MRGYLKTQCSVDISSALMLQTLVTVVFSAVYTSLFDRYKILRRCKSEPNLLVLLYFADHYYKARVNAGVLRGPIASKRISPRCIRVEVHESLGSIFAAR
jgi:hypothetical protein